MNFCVAIPKDIIDIVTLLPTYQTVGLKLVHDEFIKSDTLEEEEQNDESNIQKLKITLTNTDLIKTIN